MVHIQHTDEVISIENINYADFLIKPRSSWIEKSTTNLYCNLNGLPDIVKVFQKVGELQELRKTCFRHLLGIPKELTFSAGVLHNLLLRQIDVPGVTGVNELHFLVGGKMAKFSQMEFFFVTGLQFGVMSDIFLQPYAATKDGIHVRYFENDENIRLTDVWARFLAGGFDQPKDGLKMALVLIANNVLFGQDLRRKVTLWLFKMHVVLEELHPTNDEKTQPYLVGVDTDLSDGPQFVPLNVELDDGEQQLDDDVDEDGNDSGNDGDRFEDIVKKEIKKEISALEGRLNAQLTSVEASLAKLVNQRR
ncbi:hypothetical protein Dsin_001947 [Dipteronia sinensis]|uniref:Uncharacterized protein n=1 Tax=Dipteronia sinensis TaxID=43782 RepID=A0AAE0B4V1_9ROSI|nr:hypothetical protein Dsin_001947 [Dipteronia sinensis]